MFHLVTSKHAGTEINWIRENELEVITLASVMIKPKIIIPPTCPSCLEFFSHGITCDRCDF